MPVDRGDGKANANIFKFHKRINRRHRKKSIEHTKGSDRTAKELRMGSKDGEPAVQQELTWSSGGKISLNDVFIHRPRLDFTTVAIFGEFQTEWTGILLRSQLTIGFSLVRAIQPSNFCHERRRYTNMPL